LRAILDLKGYSLIQVPNAFAGTWRGPLAVPLLLLLSLSFFGCGGQVGTLHGKVTLDGAPVKKGTMYIACTTPKVIEPLNVNIVEGEFHTSGLPAGEYALTPFSFKETGKTIEVHGDKSKETISIIPPKYAAGEIIKITSGENTYDLKMVSK
jgi:hypothetical protein